MLMEIEGRAEGDEIGEMVDKCPPDASLNVCAPYRVGSIMKFTAQNQNVKRATFHWVNELNLKHADSQLLVWKNPARQLGYGEQLKSSSGHRRPQSMGKPPSGDFPRTHGWWVAGKGQTAPVEAVCRLTPLKWLSTMSWGLNDYVFDGGYRYRDQANSTRQPASPLLKIFSPSPDIWILTEFQHACKLLLLSDASKTEI